MEYNQLGAATQQMNTGHCQGVFTAGYTFWNWCKIIQMHFTLQAGFKDARQHFEKMLHLCISDHLPSFRSLSIRSDFLTSQPFPTYIGILTEHYLLCCLLTPYVFYSSVYFHMISLFTYWTELDLYHFGLVYKPSHLYYLDFSFNINLD